jgi:hypothetical protein
VHLYADYAPKLLMDFLQGSQTYPLEAALEVAAARGMVDEQVWAGHPGSKEQGALFGVLFFLVLCSDAFSATAFSLDVLSCLLGSGCCMVLHGVGLYSLLMCYAAGGSLHHLALWARWWWW